MSTKQMASGGEEDRLSNLPDAIADCILSNLVDFDDFARLMLVSKRWNQLCLSSTRLSSSLLAPCLTMTNYNNSTHDHHLTDHSHCFMGHKQVRIVWSSFDHLHPADLIGKKRKIRYQKKSCCDIEDPVFTCLRECVSCCDPENVEVYLLLRQGGRCKPSLSSFFVKTIRNLVLTMNNAPLSFPKTLKYLRRPPFSRLRNLTLKSVKLPSKTFGNVISEVCRRLKVLRLYQCTGLKHLAINQNNLEHLEIIQEKSCDLSYLYLFCHELKTLLITWYPKTLTGASVYLSYPVIQHVEWKGSPLHCVKYHKENRHIIKSTAIYCTWPTGRSLDECCGIDLSWVVSTMMNAESLRLLAMTVEILFKQWRKRGVLITLLKGVETLHIDDCYLTDDEVHAIAFILEMMPNVNTIYISSSKAISHTLLEVFGFYKMDGWKANDVKSIKNGLKTKKFTNKAMQQIWSQNMKIYK